ncbi:putative Nuclear export mediator factor Nemf [Venustampulla echinocandica]|uniref:Ribosome quality control complex subunit 2 n=1 Tax=Venustampulla echinocandica TaxID=2656787 RepID=A0A370U1S1_9HELO|nr:putative Nuclear export mediator factor Nemf [Venustampulla echinocandica]RDL41693.1 putative Nuclear export mediator factor Nemf [Venustampulla echinocandica]
MRITKYHPAIPLQINTNGGLSSQHNATLLKMKQRFSSLDVKVIAHELSNALTTLRVANIYDLSSKIFLVKFAKPDNKQQIVIDSGFRCHLTEYARATAAEPSDFVRRLRKFLKTRRVTSVSQIGTDRIIEFQFSDGQYKLFLEFYASGNVILTDKELNILVLQRIVHEGEGQEELRAGLKYSLENRQNYGGIPELTTERLRNALQKAVDRGEEQPVARKKGKKNSADALRRALAVSITEYPPMLVDHAMRVTNFDSSVKPAEVLQSEVLLGALMRSLQEAKRVIHEITSSEVSTGYIIAKKKEGYEKSLDADDIETGLMYDDFHPFRPRQFEGGDDTVFLEFEGFNKTVDEFFSSIEGQKLESKLQERELTAKRKITAARQDQAKRLGGLQELQTMNERKAGAIEANVERVQEAMDAVNSLIAQGMDWVEIGKLIEVEQTRNNPVASIIQLPLKLQENTISLLLDEEAFGDDDSAYETDSDVSDSEDEEARKPKPKQKSVEQRLTIDINLGLSPWSNAREYYDQRRSAATKEQKTLESSTKALKSQEAKIAQDLKKGLKQEKAILRPVRKQMWFEKFIWFISSDGYLVLGGKDAQQHEMLYKKYLKKSDVYVHAEIEGATPVIIRNISKDSSAPIPPSTLSQAGNLVVACSNAWDSKAGMSAWWTHADQVSKSAPGGGFLPPGSFSIHGSKNFLPPAQLLLGFGVAFQISEESKANHVKHRVQDLPNEDPAAERIRATQPSAEDVEADREIDSADNENLGVDREEQESDEEGQGPRLNPLQNRSKDLLLNSVGHESPITQDMATIQISEPNPVESLQQDDSDPEDANETEAQYSTGAQTPSQQGNNTKDAPLKRGKKGKAKKIARKYKDQDEEDLLAAQQLIGASAGLEKARAEAEAKAKREAELAFQKERRRAQHQRTQEETAAHEEMRKMNLAHGVDDFDDQEEWQMTALDTLVGTPLRGDEILEAIPICAPWAALSRFKYKAKLQPGAQKKGKAVKEIVGRWLADATSKGRVDERSEDPELMWPREVDLVKGWKVEEVTNTVPVSKVRVMMAGGSAGGAAKGAQGKPKGSKGGSGKGSKKAR